MLFNKNEFKIKLNSGKAKVLLSVFMNVSFALLICSTLIFLLTIPIASANDYYVATWGNDSNLGTSPDEPFSSFDKSLSIMDSGDTLYLFDGVWTDEYFDFHSHDLHGSPNNPVFIRAYNGSPTIKNGIDGKSVIDTSYENWIFIDGITVTDSYRGYLAGYNNNLTIVNCTFLNMTADGVKFWRQVSDTLIDNVTVSNCGDHGIHYFNQIDSEIVQNHVITNSSVSNCAHNMLDIHTSINNVLIENNEFYFTNDYTDIKQVGIYLHNGDTDYIQILNNRFYDQPRPLEIINSENVLIENNVFLNIEGNSRAIMLTSGLSDYDSEGISSNITIKNNLVDSSYYGVYFWSTSSTYSDIYIINNSMFNITNIDYYYADGIFLNPIVFSENEDIEPEAQLSCFDVNKDGVIDRDDVYLVVTNYGKKLSIPYPRWDIN